MSELTSIERIQDAARAKGLRITPMRDGECMMQCPVHTPDNSPSVHLSYDAGERRTLLCDQHDAYDRGLTLQILQALGLDYTALFDETLKRDAARNRFNRWHKHMTREQLEALAGIHKAKATVKQPPEGVLEPFKMPAPFVPENCRGGLSEQFKALCVALEIAPAYGVVHAACPVCGEAEALGVLYVPLEHATMFRCSSCGGDAGYGNKLMAKLGVGPARWRSNGGEITCYDSERGTVYEYPDGARVYRRAYAETPGDGHKGVKSPGTGGRHPVWQADLLAEYRDEPHTFFLVEGEKDAATLWAVGYAATSVLGGAGGFKARLDVEASRAVLAGVDLVAVVDRDEQGERWREQVEELLRPVVKTLTFVQAHGGAHDAADAVMMGEGFDMLPQTEPEPPANTDMEPEEEGSVDADPLKEAGDDWEWFWQSRPYLTKIRDAARQKGVSPDATLASALCLVSVMLPPDVVVPAFVGNYPASLNLFAAIVGHSGGGKGAAYSVASGLVPDLRGAVVAKSGSGESIAAMFAERVTEPSGKEGEAPRSVLQCANRRALLNVPEVKSLGAVKDRKGSTLVPELTSAWSGEPLGSRTKYDTGTLTVPRYGYRLALITGVQPGNAGALLDEAETGLPQRFLWAEAQDVHALKWEQVIRGYRVMPLVDSSSLPPDNEAISTLYREGSRENMIGEGDANYPLHEVRFPGSVWRETFEQRRATLTGETPDGLDAHGNLVRIKVAALLPWLDAEREDHMTVTEEDWQTAGHILEHSQRVRAKCIAMQEDSRREQITRREKIKKEAAQDAYEEMEELRSQTRGKIIAYFNGTDKKTKKSRKNWVIKGRDIRSGIGHDWARYVPSEIEALAEAGKLECVKAGESAMSSYWRLPVETA